VCTVARIAERGLTRDPLGQLVAMATAAGDLGQPLRTPFNEEKMTRILVTDRKALACDRNSGDVLERRATQQRALDVFNHASS
jgi:hypothetical protein